MNIFAELPCVDRTLLKVVLAQRPETIRLIYSPVDSVAKMSFFSLFSTALEI